jgi:hypothetical protein
VNDSTKNAESQRIIDIAGEDFDFVSRLRHLSESVDTDAAVWGTLVQEHYQPQAIRRMYVRLFISFVESVLATLKADMLEEIDDLSNAERALLSETTYDLSDQGKPVEKASFVSIQKSLRFVFTMYAEMYGVQPSQNYGDDGWAAFLDAIRIRNRITHPRRVDELSISDDEMVRIDKAHDWVIASYRGILQSIISKLESQRQELRSET